MKDDYVTKTDLAQVLLANNAKLRKELREDFRQDMRELLYEHTEVVIKPLIYKIATEVVNKAVDAAVVKIVKDVNETIVGFVSSTNGRFEDLEYDVSKNKQDITALKRVANVKLYNRT